MSFDLFPIPPFAFPSDLLPKDPALLAHCRRVAAVSRLVAHELSLPEREGQPLSAACLLHHYDCDLLSEAFVERLLADTGGHWIGGPRVDPVPPAVREVLSVFRSPRSGAGNARKLAEILRVADTFDQECEASPLDLLDIWGVMDRLSAAADSGHLDRAVVEALRRATMTTPLGDDPLSWQFPGLPEVAAQMLQLMQNQQVNFTQLVEVAGADPATGGRITQLANSELFSGHPLVSTLSQAVLRLGSATARKVALSFAARPLLTSSDTGGLWPHSLEVADLAEQLAHQTGRVDPAEAYLAGLLHDVGRIVLRAVPASAHLRALEQIGCPTVYSENLLLRTDHARLGACVAAAWDLPPSIVEAIHDHHRPEAASSPLAHLLYVAEYLSDAEEDLPSVLRLECAVRGIGVAVDEVSDFSISALAASMAALK